MDSKSIIEKVKQRKADKKAQKLLDMIENCKAKEMRSFKFKTIFKALKLVKGANLNYKGYMGYTPLIAACRRNYCVIANAIADAGADVNIQDNEGNTAYMWAEIYNHKFQKPENIELVMNLKSCGADESIKNNAGQTVKEMVNGTFFIYDYDESLNPVLK